MAKPTKATNGMKASVLALLAAAAATTAFSGFAQAQAPKPWKHGIIAPKADAGFLLMAAKRGFAEREGLKLELLEVKDDQIGLKALLAGELEAMKAASRRDRAMRGADVKIMAATGRDPARHHGQGRGSTRWRTSRASRSRCRHPAVSRHAGSRRADQAQITA
jgi:hypothetical protein